MLLGIEASFRLGMEAQGSEDMIALIDTLPHLLAECNEADVKQLNKMLSAMQTAQLRKDYLYLADILKYELAPLVIGDITHYTRLDS